MNPHVLRERANPGYDTASGCLELLRRLGLREPDHGELGDYGTDRRTAHHRAN